MNTKMKEISLLIVVGVITSLWFDDVFTHLPFNTHRPFFSGLLLGVTLTFLYSEITTQIQQYLLSPVYSS